MVALLLVPGTVANAQSNMLNGHEYVDLGLSVKWATCNVGASSPTGYGDYYAWGEVNTKTEYTEENSLTYGKKLSNICGDTRYDVARANWGGSWRLPSASEMDELVKNCTWEWTTIDDVSGYKVISNVNSNWIFLPAAGQFLESSIEFRGGIGSYWTGSTDKNDIRKGGYMIFFTSSKIVCDGIYRYNSISVRPVAE